MFAMATASVPVEPNEEECSVCHEQFTEPKLLPCGHLLCRHCLLSWLKSQAEAKCPLCRCAIVEPEERGSKSLEDIADGFPTDLAMAALVEADRLLNKGHNCCVCEDVAATSLCLNCGDMFCQSCRKLHNKQSVSKHHTVEDLSSLTPDKVAVNRPATCAVHADETCKLFCPTHGVSICHVCATSRHRSCPEVKDLEEKVEEARAVLAELAAMLSAGETELGTAISQLDQQLRETEKRTRAAIAEMEATCDRLESAIKACRHRLKELAETAVYDVKEAVHAGKTCLLQRRGKLTSHKRVVERVQETKSRDIVTEMTSFMKTRVDDLDFSVTLPADAKVVSMVTLVIDQEAVAVVERMLAELGQVKVVPADVAATRQATSFSFHDNHGTGIVLSDDKRTAERTSDSWDGIVLSRDPMVENTVYEVKVEEIDTSQLSACTGLGAVTQSPDTDTGALPQVSWHLQSAVGVCPYCVCINGSVIFTEQFSALDNVKAGSRIGVWLDTHRHLHVLLDGEDLGVAVPDTPLTRPCYAFFDLGFRLKKATAFSFHDNHGTGIVLSDDKQTAERTAGSFDGIVLSRDPMVENTVYEATEFSFHDNHGTGIVLSDDKQTAERTADSLDEIVTSPDPMMENTVHEATAFSFHDNHGTGIVLSVDKQTAERTLRFADGIVLSRDPMMENTVYEVKVEEINTSQLSACTGLGAVTQSPDTDTGALPRVSWRLQSAVGVCPFGVCINGSVTFTEQFSVLRNVRAGSRIGVGVDTHRQMHVLLDGEDLGVAAPDTPLTQPCYAFFDLGFWLEKVRALPERKMNW